MTQPTSDKPHNPEPPAGGSTIAPLQNVALAVQGMEYALNRPPHLSGTVCLYGPSGWAKSWSAAYVAGKFRAYYIEADETWSRKALLRNLLKQMGIKFGRSETLSELLDKAVEQLVLSRRPLIIDEFDHVVAKRIVDTVRALGDKSQAAILIVGEEQLPEKLKEFERFHGRMLDWLPAAPADNSDGKRLRDFYGKGQPQVADDLVARIVELAQGSVRRICVNLEKAHERARELGVNSIDLATWGDRAFFTGNAPVRRV
jgi:hypothetical protein